MNFSGNDIELLELFKQGKPNAEHIIFKKFFKPLCIYAHTITNSLEAAEDIVSEALVKVFNRRSEFIKLENIQAFSYVLVRNACLNYRKTAQRQLAFLDQLSTASSFAEIDNALKNEIRLAELVDIVHKEIENLPTRCRIIFKKLLVEGLSTEKIANQLHISPQTVRTQKARAIEILKTEFLKRQLYNTLFTLFLLLKKFQA